MTNVPLVVLNACRSGMFGRVAVEAATSCRQVVMHEGGLSLCRRRFERDNGHPVKAGTRAARAGRILVVGDPDWYRINGAPPLWPCTAARRKNGAQANPLPTDFHRLSI